MTIDRNKFFDQHKVFPSSFLHGAALSISFPEIITDNSAEKLNAFLKHDFGVDGNYNQGDTIGNLDLQTDNKLIRFMFSDSRAAIKVNSDNYTSYAESLYPLTKTLYDYVETVAGYNAIDSMSIEKRNVWSIDTDTPDQTLPQAINHIFRAPRAKEILSLGFEGKSTADGIAIDPHPVIPGIDANLEIELRIKYFNDSKLVFNLGLIASSKESFALSEFKTKGFYLNQSIYYLFLDMVSDSILQSMLNES